MRLKLFNVWAWGNLPAGRVVTRLPRDVNSFVRSIAAELEAEQQRGDTPIVRRKVRSMIRQCGRAKRTQPLLNSVEAKLADAGVYADPDITDIDLGLDTYVRFTLAPPPPIGKIFKPERALAYHLSKWPNELERLLPHLGRLRLKYGGQARERTYGFEGMQLKPDIVFDSDSGNHLACELERGDPKYESVDQLEYYIRSVQAREGPTVGVLITGSPRTHGLRNQIARGIERLNASGLEAHWFTYDVDVVLTRRLNLEDA